MPCDRRFPFTAPAGGNRYSISSTNLVGIVWIDLSDALNDWSFRAELALLRSALVQIFVEGIITSAFDFGINGVGSLSFDNDRRR